MVLVMCYLLCLLARGTYSKCSNMDHEATTASDELSQVIRVFPESTEDLIFLKNLINVGHYDAWLEPRAVGFPVDIMAEGAGLEYLLKIVRNKEFFYKIFIDDVMEKVRQNIAENELAKLIASKTSTNFTWTAYHTYKEILEWYNYLSYAYPSRVSLIPIGYSYELQPMYIIKLFNRSQYDPDRPIIWIDGGMHGREWISPATVTYMLNELVTNPVYDYIFDELEFYFVPVLNPDGYNYTFSVENEKARLWAKTCSPIPFSNCIGADLNRNWSYEWHGSYTPCKENYSGEVPFSERELQNVLHQISNHAYEIKSYISYQSYGQLWLYPWGYTYEHIDDINEVEPLAEDVVNAMHSYNGTRYEQQPLCNKEDMCIYGTAIDWMRGDHDIKYPFQAQLPDMGTNGYLLPPSAIIPTGEESLRGLLVIVEEVMDELASVKES